LGMRNATAPLNPLRRGGEGGARSAPGEVATFGASAPTSNCPPIPHLTLPSPPPGAERVSLVEPSTRGYSTP
jgi:hypothetical protein